MVLKINPKIFDNTIGIDFDKIESKINETNINDGESTVANSDQDRFAKYMKEVAEKEDYRPIPDDRGGHMIPEVGVDVSLEKDGGVSSQ